MSQSWWGWTARCASLPRCAPVPLPARYCCRRRSAELLVGVDCEMCVTAEVGVRECPAVLLQARLLSHSCHHAG